MRIYHFILGIEPRDWLIALALIILLILILRIRHLKKIITDDVLARLMPQLGLLIEGSIIKEFYLKNFSTSIARNIRIEDINLDVYDFGYKISLRIAFDNIDSLNPIDKVRLNYRIFSGGSEITDQDKKDAYMNHIVINDFDCRIHYKNIQDNPFSSHVVNRNGKLSIREITHKK
jgi:hypothetical protein